jgi:hypothetical protein
MTQVLKVVSRMLSACHNSRGKKVKESVLWGFFLKNIFRILFCMFCGNVEMSVSITIGLMALKCTKCSQTPLFDQFCFLEFQNKIKINVCMNVAPSHSLT